MPTAIQVPKNCFRGKINKTFKTRCYQTETPWNGQKMTSLCPFVTLTFFHPQKMVPWNPIPNPSVVSITKRSHGCNCRENRFFCNRDIRALWRIYFRINCVDSVVPFYLTHYIFFLPLLNIWPHSHVFFGPGKLWKERNLPHFLSISGKVTILGGMVSQCQAANDICLN